MSRITVDLDIVNLVDEELARREIIAESEIRTVSVQDALVDTGATLLSLPIDVIERLGLSEFGTTTVRTTNGIVTRRLFRGAFVTVAGRKGEFQVVELPRGIPALVGHTVLEQLDLHIDLKARKLTGSSDSPDEMVIECYSAHRD